MTSNLKKDEVKLDLLTDLVMLLTVGKFIRGGICHQYTKTNHK